MRPLTASEAGVISLLLGAEDAESERARIRRAGVARSTYQDVRRRAFAEGWLTDRFVPSPSALGFEVGLTLSAHPFAERVDSLREVWRHEPGVVVAWASPLRFFGVVFCRDGAAADAALARLTDPSSVQHADVVRMDLTKARALPVYFDFEGAWDHLAGLPGPARYPRGLSDSSLRPIPWSPALRGAAQELLARSSTDASGRPPHRRGIFGLPRSQRRVLALGMMAHRVLLDPSRLPRFGTLRPDIMVLVTGRLVPPHSGSEVLANLVGRGVFPFFMAEGGGRVLLLLLGQKDPPSTATSGRPGPVRSTVLEPLAGTLEGVEISREAWSDLERLVDHRYDRLLDVDLLVGPRRAPSGSWATAGHEGAGPSKT